MEAAGVVGALAVRRGKNKLRSMEDGWRGVTQTTVEGGRGRQTGSRISRAWKHAAVATKKLLVVTRVPVQ